MLWILLWIFNDFFQGPVNLFNAESFVNHWVSRLQKIHRHFGKKFTGNSFWGFWSQNKKFTDPGPNPFWREFFSVNLGPWSSQIVITLLGAVIWCIWPITFGCSGWPKPLKRYSAFISFFLELARGTPTGRPPLLRGVPLMYKFLGYLLTFLACACSRNLSR